MSAKISLKIAADSASTLPSTSVESLAGGTASGSSAGDPAPFRGEAVAYLASWTARLASATRPASVGGPAVPHAAWEVPGESEGDPARYALAYGLFGVNWPSSRTTPRLSLFRMRVLDYQRLRRAPVAPPLSAPSSDVPDKARLVYDSDLADPLPSEFDPLDVAAGYSAAGSQAGLDANLGRWLAPASPRDPFGTYATDFRAAVAWIASVSSPQPDAALADGGFAAGYVPPQVPGDPATDPPQPVSASAVRALFASALASGMSRCWSVTRGMDPFAALAGTTGSAYYRTRGSVPLAASEEKPWGTGYAEFSYRSRAVMLRNYEAMTVSGFAALQDEASAESGSWARSHSHDGTSDPKVSHFNGIAQDRDQYYELPKLSGYWGYASTGSGSRPDLDAANRLGAVHHVTVVSRVRGAAETGVSPYGGSAEWWALSHGGPSWEMPLGPFPVMGLWPMNLAVSTVAEIQEDPDDPEGSMPDYPNGNVSYYNGVYTVRELAPSGVADGGRFDLEYRYQVSRTTTEAEVDIAPDGPTAVTARSPLAPGDGGSPVPLPSPDHVGIRPVFVAFVELTTRTLSVGIEANAGAAEECIGDGSTYSYSALSRSTRTRVRRWTVAGFAPSVAEWTRAAGAETGYASPSGARYVLGAAGPGTLAGFVADRVLAACGLPAEAKDVLSPAPQYEWFERAAHGNVEVSGDDYDYSGVWPCRTHDAIVYHSVYYDGDGERQDGGGALQVGEWTESPGEYVTAADVQVDVSFPVCAFESGYCA